MATEPERTYWDSCVFIDALRQTTQPEDRWSKISKLIARAKAGKSTIWTSALAIAEVVRGKEHGQLSEEEERKIRALFFAKFVKLIPVDRLIAKHAAEIVRTFTLKPPDAVHVATAIRCRCEVLYTYDGGDGDPRKILTHHGQIGLPAMPIKRPGEWGQSEIEFS